MVDGKEMDIVVLAYTELERREAAREQNSIVTDNKDWGALFVKNVFNFESSQ